MGRTQKTGMLNAWAKTAEKDAASFRRIFVDALGFEPVGDRPSEEAVVHDASEASSQVTKKTVASWNYAVGKATALCEDLRSLISEISDREMYQSLRACAEGYVNYIETHLLPEARLPRSVERCLR